ncbi:5-formyltetrahydrofolate cyclo-ligase [Arenicella xantha]|uniref:5-formyltetrahydrofolate cyclo-ligase n=2 Tax=Arenicella xantha TaxID=644221 RepID=A0A395JKY5_9GAMM|nr:5-formyltetrahydrofolate cyclo-ligase [Arenicella xantha]
MLHQKRHQTLKLIDITSGTMLRREMRQQRSALSSRQSKQAMLDVANIARQCKPLLFATRIASYSPFNGELSPALIETPNCHQHFLPRVDNYTRHLMRFYSANHRRTNRWGIVEPIPTAPAASINQLDVILVPLVAFDRKGNRLGMGAGFYDRALQSLRHRANRRPLLVGVGHHFQEVNSLISKPWDIKLDAILTDREYIVVGSSLS